MKTVCIVQARTGSSRFPCKILASLHGKPMLSHVLERAAAIQGVDQVVLAVPESDVRLVKHLWPHVYGGSEHDVLARYWEAATEYKADIILRATGDCPMLAPDIAEYAVRIYEMNRYSYTGMCQPYAQVADGWDVEVFPLAQLREANEYAKASDREHVTTYLRRVHKYYARPWLLPDYTDLKCSVDTETDLARVSLIMDHLEDKNDFSHTATWQAWEKAGRP